ncbi:metal-dependent hydrolase [Clostridium paridis]|uniref:Metal-dependent hydrolase n=1 Tax=Clostridium paridis TaxID=2803863 RepID=A0A937FFI3_9CLOT|nr:metal-dependent hydrolase [Clostridium paridis]MBL4930952.1 metal-dependent hydrolase [Clostridium paridis]
MLKKTHLAMGIATTITFITTDNMLIAPIALVGSIAPDWDVYLGIKHRTLTHSLIALLGSSYLLFTFNEQLGVLWGINYLTHLLLDSLTKTGVPLLFPFHKKYQGLKLFKTGGAEDLFISLILIYIILSAIRK